MKKTKKQIKHISIVLSVLVVLFSIFYFFHLSLGFQSFLGTSAYFRFHEFSLTDSGNYYQVQAKAMLDNYATFNTAQSGIASGEAPIYFDVSWESYQDNYLETGQGIVVNVPSDSQNKLITDNIQINNLFGAYRPKSGYPDRGQIELTITNKSADCSVSQNSISCHVTAFAKPTDYSKTDFYSYMGQTEIIIDGKILKQGIECLDNSYCSDGNTCSNNQCISQLNTYYELTNNQCSSVQKLSSEKLDNNYLSLTDCQNHLNNCPIQQTQKPCDNATQITQNGCFQGWDDSLCQNQGINWTLVILTIATILIVVLIIFFAKKR